MVLLLPHMGFLVSVSLASYLGFVLCSSPPSEQSVLLTCAHSSASRLAPLYAGLLERWVPPSLPIIYGVAPSTLRLPRRRAALGRPSTRLFPADPRARPDVRRVSAVAPASRVLGGYLLARCLRLVQPASLLSRPSRPLRPYARAGASQLHHCFWDTHLLCASPAPAGPHLFVGPVRVTLVPSFGRLWPSVAQSMLYSCPLVAFLQDERVAVRAM